MRERLDEAVAYSEKGYALREKMKEFAGSYRLADMIAKRDGATPRAWQSAQHRFELCSGRLDLRLLDPSQAGEGRTADGGWKARRSHQIFWPIWL